MDKGEIIGLQSVSDFQVNYYDSTLVLRFNMVETGNLPKACILKSILDSFFEQSYIHFMENGQFTFLTVIISRNTMYMDSPLAIYTENDGIVSLMHCEEWNSVFFMRIEYSESSLKFTVLGQS